MVSSKHLRGDINYAWPTAAIAVMGAKVSHFERVLVVMGDILYCGKFHQRNVSLKLVATNLWQ